MCVLLHTKARVTTRDVQIVGYTGPDKSGNGSKITHKLSLKLRPEWHHSPSKFLGCFLLCKLWLKLPPQCHQIRPSNCSFKCLNISISHIMRRATTFKCTGHLRNTIWQLAEALRAQEKHQCAQQLKWKLPVALLFIFQIKQMEDCTHVLRQVNFSSIEMASAMGALRLSFLMIHMI